MEQNIAAKPINKLDIEFITPQITTPDALNARDKIIDMFGQDILRSIQILSYIRHEIELGGTKKPHVYWQLIKQVIKILASNDPFQPHYEIARTVLAEIAPEFLDDTQVIDLLARELNNSFKILNAKLNPPKDFKELLEAAKNDSDQCAIDNNYPIETDLEILECPESNNKFESLFIKQHMFIWDHAFLSLLKTMGQKGEIAATAIAPKLEKQLQDFKATKANPLNHWINVNSTETNIYISKHFITLGTVIYDSKIIKTIKIRMNYVPANKSPDHDFLSKLLSPKTSIEHTESEIKMFNEGKQLLHFPIAAMSKDIVTRVANGIALFKKANAFRIVRNFSKQPFYKFANGDPDFRVLQYPRGTTGLAEECGISSGDRSIGEVNEIIHAMAFGCFNNGTSEGNLIQLTKNIPSKINQNPGFTITVGTLLIPYGELIDELLIPLLTEPILVSSPQTYAGQYYLHMQISREFSMQSVLFAQTQFIKITPQQLELMAKQAELRPATLKKVMDRWTHDGDDGPRMLEKIEDDFYTLGPSLNREAEFLKQQGLKRLKNSQKGINSAQIRTKKK